MYKSCIAVAARDESIPREIRFAYLTGYTSPMKYLGIDYGSKRVGIAISDDAGKIAFPRGVIANDAAVFVELATVIVKERIQSIVVGDTRSFGGRKNPVTQEADRFIEQLKAEAGVPIIPAFEAGSSIEASQYAPDGEKRDDAAAAFILQRYLDMHVPGVDSDHA